MANWQWIGRQLQLGVHFMHDVAWWPENTDPRSVDPPTDPVHGLPYGPVYGPLLRNPPKKIAEKENKRNIKRNDKKIWLTIWMNWPLMSAKIRTFTSAKLTDSAQGNINCIFRCGDVWKTTKNLYALKIENFICVHCFASAILFGSVSCIRDHELDPGLTKNNTTCILSRAAMDDHGWPSIHSGP